MQLERSGTFVERCAGGHHVVEQKKALAAEIGGAMEGVADILAARFPRQTGLRLGRTDTLAMTAIDRPTQRTTQRARQFQRLIEAAFAQAGRMQRQGNDAIKLQSLRQRRQLLGKKSTGPGGGRT